MFEMCIEMILFYLYLTQLYSFGQRMPQSICIVLFGECLEKVVLEDGARSRPEASGKATEFSLGLV